MLTFLLWPLVASAARVEEGIPQPHGWIGTTTDWARGLGIAFALLDLALLAVAWWLLYRSGQTPAVKQMLFAAVAILPLTVVFFGYHYGLEASKSVESCGACHVMAPYVRDLRSPASETLAAVHFKNRYILENHCYTCHSDYGMFGTVQAKWEGLGHVVRHAKGRYGLPLTIAHPYANRRCLHCHGESQKFLKSPGHVGEVMPGIIAGQTSCLDCHGPAHPRAARKATP